MLDGFTRWEAAQQVRGMTTLLVRLIEVDDRRAKAAIYGLNQTGRRPYELEEAWIVQVAGARGRPVPDRGGRAAGPAQELGLPAAGLAGEALPPRSARSWKSACLTPTAAREIARLPAGNQSEVLDVSRREALSRDELGGVVRLLLGAVTAEQKLFVLTKPREALGQAGATPSRRAGTPGSARAATA